MAATDITLEWQGVSPYDSVFVLRKQLLHPSETEWWVIDPNTWNPYEPLSTFISKTTSQISSHPCRISIPNTGGIHTLVDTRGGIVGAFAYQIVQCLGGILSPVSVTYDELDTTDHVAECPAMIHFPEFDSVTITDASDNPRGSFSVVPASQISAKSYADARLVSGADFPSGVLEVKGIGLRISGTKFYVNDLRENTIEWVP